MNKQTRRKATLLLLAFLATSAVASALTELVPLGSTWRFLDDGSNQGSAWTGISFDDSGWAAGPAELGYGDGGEATVVSFGGDSANKHITTYFRHSFDLADPAALGALQLEVQRDDGVVIYLNGTEIFRDNLPAGPIGYKTLASVAVGGTSETTLLQAVVDPALLVEGTNTISAEIHQANATSSDISFNLRLSEAPAPLLELVPLGSTWRFLDNGSDQGSAWTGNSFDDSGWAAGPAELGYGDGGEATVVSFGGNSANKHITTYFRHSFDLADPAALDALQLEVQRDDGVVVYLNGTEVFRDNLPAGPIGHKTLASSAVAGSNETALLRAGVDPALLVEGTNTIAAEIHQANATSSDISFNLRLAEAPPAALVRGPYLQRSSASQITVRWRTSAATDSVVRYGANPEDLAFTASSPALTTEHSVTIAGLQPDSRYSYSIGSSDVTFAAGSGLHFDTHPPTGTAVPTRIWVLGDSGTANANAAAVRDAYTGYNAGSTQADVWLMLGDNAYNDGTDAEYQAAVFNMYPDTLKNSVLWSTLGNHDGYSASSATQSGPYYDIHTFPTGGESGGVPSGTEAYYSFDYGNIHFVCLDSYETSRATDAAMASWLENDLAATNQEWIIAFWHHPPYSKGSHNSDTEARMVEMRQNFLPILEQYGVDLILSGHSHSYERSMLIDGHYGLSSTFGADMIIDGGDGKPAGDGAYVKTSATAHSGAIYAVAGSSGKVTTAPLNHPIMISNLLELGSMVLDVDGDQLNAVFLNDKGAIRDSFTIIHQAPTTEVPEPPTGLMATPLNSGEIALAWTDNSATEDSFTVERTLDSSNWSIIATLPANTTSFTDSGLTAGTTYSYQVSASNVNGNSANSNIASATTESIPPYLGSIASSETTGFGTVLGDFTLTHADDGSVQSLTEVESGGKPTSRHSLLLHTWRFDLPAGTSSTLLANVYTGGSTDGDSFHFEYSADGGNIWVTAFVVSSVDPNNTEAVLLNGVVEGPLLVRVSDTDRTPGNRALDTVYVDELHIHTDTVPGEPPAAPTALSAVAVSESEIQLAWIDNASDELGYEIERRNAGTDPWIFLANAAIDSSSYSDITVAANSSYSYRIRAFNASGASLDSNEANATTPPAPIPSGLVLETSVSKIKGVIAVNLNWSNATSDNIDVFRNGEFLLTVPNTGSYTDNTGLKGGGSLTYQVREAGNAATLSNESTVTF